MNVSEWLALAAILVTILGGLGGAYLLLAGGISRAEKASKEYANTLVNQMWQRADDKFATKVDIAEIHGKLDTILVEIRLMKPRSVEDESD